MHIVWHFRSRSHMTYKLENVDIKEESGWRKCCKMMSAFVKVFAFLLVTSVQVVLIKLLDSHYYSIYSQTLHKN